MSVFSLVPGEVLLVGIKDSVCAIARADGVILWSTSLGGGISGSNFVTILCDGARVFAYRNGHLHCLDFATGDILWTNEMKGFGYGLAVLSLPGGASTPDPSILQHVWNAQQQSSAPGATVN